MSAVNLMTLKPVLEKRGGALVGVAPDDVCREDFMTETRWTDNMHVDEAKVAYGALDLPRNGCHNCWGCCICCNSIGSWYDKSKKQGYTNTLKGDMQQNGGTFLIGVDGRTLYAHRQTPDDFEPNMNAILDALGATDLERRACGAYPEPSWIK